jgi:hypothetical protein
VAWGNLGFVADVAYLSAVLGYAHESPGPILECGSGLTTVLLGLLEGRPVWSLEHLRAWRRSVQVRLRLAGARANVRLAPLRSYDSFVWYDVPGDLPDEFGLVVCDGPPGGTPGGRYGLLPVAGKRLRPGTVVLLDDAERAERWTEEAGWDVVIKKHEDQAYGVVTVV